ncbi:lemA family protein [Firmicutes bacterium CAG:460]|jgi:LemA protein|nr:lemA family protein [Firmicutes bacterium CAG:460]
MKWWMILIIVGILIVFWAISVYNKLIALRNRVKDQWAQIDVQLKRRFDLIPNLVETVKGYTKHESETLEAVIKARNTYVSATLPEDQMKADGELTKAISKLFALTESYPELKANTNFQALQQELTETESKIASARQFYNDTVMVYNNKVDMVPSNIIASLFRFEKEAFFEANETERQNVQVKF